jgi:hypothetical protein
MQLSLPLHQSEREKKREIKRGRERGRRERGNERERNKERVRKRERERESGALAPFSYLVFLHFQMYFLGEYIVQLFRHVPGEGGWDTGVGRFSSI